MKIGLALPVFDRVAPERRPLPWTRVVEWARRAEALGFESLWVPDGAVDPFIVLAALARLTRRPRLGTLALDAGRRHPAVAAKALSTLDVVSAGRLVAGFGAGARSGHGAGVGAAYLAETCQVVAGMFEGGPFTLEGEHVRVAGARNLPRPRQRPRPPIWVDGGDAPLLDVVARHADGWSTAWTSTPDDFRRGRAALDAACERAGRDPATVTRSLGLHALVGEQPRRDGSLVGTVDDLSEQIEGWSALGVDTLVLSPGPVPYAEPEPEEVEILAVACSIGPYGRTRGA